MLLRVSWVRLISAFFFVAITKGHDWKQKPTPPVRRRHALQLSLKGFLFFSWLAIRENSAAQRQKPDADVSWLWRESQQWAHQLALDFESNQAKIVRKHDNEKHNWPNRMGKQIACNSRLTNSNVYLFSFRLEVPRTTGRSSHSIASGAPADILSMSSTRCRKPPCSPRPRPRENVS